MTSRSCQFPFAVLGFTAPPDQVVGSALPHVCRDFTQIVATSDVGEVRACLESVTQAVAGGAHAVGFLSFEAAAGLEPAAVTKAPGDLPLLWFGIGAAPVPVTAADDLAVIRGVTDATAGYEFTAWRPAWDERAYADAFAEVQSHIRDGNTYQCNLTFPLHARFCGSVTALYQNLRRAQHADYGAWIHTAEWDVVSASPELFFKLDADRRITTAPMKGTRSRLPVPADDQRQADELRACLKDRAENVMIVDLLRNDLGRIAEIGSVRVPELFTVQQFPTVWQMISIVTGKVRPEVSPVELLTALFPCGSVTGAPKFETMRIIAEVEAAARGVYCGSIGHLGPDGAACFNVAIRTVTIAADGQATYPVGSGIVADSECRREYDECLLKAHVLARAAIPTFSLIETLRWQPADGYWLHDRHLVRLQQSAAYFHFPCDVSALRERLMAVACNWRTPMRVRLLLDSDGAATIEAVPLPAAPATVRVELAPAAIDADEVFFYHKTTHRAAYDRARAASGCDDVILWNQRGEITESTIANVAVCADGVWYTPPQRCGLLAGTMRAELLASGAVVERVVTVAQLQSATAIKLFNSVRGEYSATLAAKPERNQGVDHGQR